MSPIFKNLTLDMDFSSKQKFFALFLGINSDKIHYNSISSKRAVIFCSIKSLVIWILTGHKIYNIRSGLYGGDFSFFKGRNVNTILNQSL